MWQPSRRHARRGWRGLTGCSGVGVTGAGQGAHTHTFRGGGTQSCLEWWRTNSSTFPAWALAARIVFAISPNSASCERVFALLKNLFGEQQMLALADYVQAALMLNYNGRRVG